MFLNFDENRVLEVLYWQGTPYKDVRRELDWQTETYIKRLKRARSEKWRPTCDANPSPING